MRKLNKSEIRRFVITGVLAATTDFIFLSLTSFLVQKMGLPATSVWCTVIGTLVGFIASTVVNYVLASKWVYQNFDREKMRQHRKAHVSIFVILNAIGLFIRIGIMSTFKASLYYGLNINIDDWVNVDIPSSYNFWQKLGAWFQSVFTNPSFWWFFFAFIVKAIVILTFNYVTWKKLLFKDQKLSKKVKAK